MVYINDQYHLIFIENPKCASSSVVNALIDVLKSDQKTQGRLKLQWLGLLLLALLSPIFISLNAFGLL